MNCNFYIFQSNDKGDSNYKLFSSNMMNEIKFNYKLVLFAMILFDPFLLALSGTLLRDDFIIVFGFSFYIVLIRLIWFREINKTKPLLRFFFSVSCHCYGLILTLNCCYSNCINYSFEQSIS